MCIHHFVIHLIKPLDKKIDSGRAATVEHIRTGCTPAAHVFKQRLLVTRVSQTNWQSQQMA